MIRMRAIIFLLLISSGLLSSCKHEPIDPDCYIEPVTYTAYVGELVSSKCLGCHGPNSFEPLLDSYEGLKVIVDDGRLVNVITGAPGYPMMPFQSDPLDDCHIERLKGWVENGAPE